MIIDEIPKETTRDKYKFSLLEVGQCNVLDDKTYTHDDYRRALSACYQYRKYYGLMDKVKFSIRISDNKLKIYRIK
jgi:hypothetical protein